MMSFISYLFPIMITFSLIESRREESSLPETANSHIITMQFDHIEDKDEMACYFYKVSSQCFDHLVVYPYSLRNVSDNNATYSVLSSFLVQTPQIQVVASNGLHDDGAGIKVFKRCESEFDEFNQRTKSHDKKHKKCKDLGSHTWPYTVYFCLRKYVDINMTNDGNYCIVSDQMVKHCGDDLIVPDLPLTMPQYTSSPTSAPITTAPPTLSPTANTTSGNGTGEIMINRPENGTGPILISYPDYPADVDADYDESMVNFVIDKECLNENNVSMDNVIAIILSAYSGCIELFDSEDPYYDSDNFASIALYMNLLCNLSTAQQTGTYLNYDELCIEFILHPVFSGANVKCETDDFSADSLKYWGLDLLDTHFNNNDTVVPSYTYPVASLDDTNHVHLYIIDQGIQADHQEFETGQVISEAVSNRLTQGPCFEESGNNKEWCTHGTHVAGIAGGKTVGASRNFKIHDYCIYQPGQRPLTTMAYAAKAIQKVIANLKQRRNNNRDSRGVINMSFGFPRDRPTEEDYEGYFKDIIANGGVAVVAAGNEDSDAKTLIPAKSNLAITVGAYSLNNYHTFDKGSRLKAVFSNYGPKVDIWAPGQLIYSSIASDDNDKYEYWSGTSMSAPMITGMVANMLFANKTLNLTHIKKKLLGDMEVEVEGDECDVSTCIAPIYVCPEDEPTQEPTIHPTPSGPTQEPSEDPTIDPTKDPTIDPTKNPTYSELYLAAHREMNHMQRFDDFTSKGRNADYNMKTPSNISRHNLYGFAGLVLVFTINALCLMAYVRCKESKIKQKYESEV